MLRPGYPQPTTMTLVIGVVVILLFSCRNREGNLNPSNVSRGCQFLLEEKVRPIRFSEQIHPAQRTTSVVCLSLVLVSTTLKRYARIHNVLQLVQGNIFERLLRTLNRFTDYSDRYATVRQYHTVTKNNSAPGFMKLLVRLLRVSRIRGPLPKLPPSDCHVSIVT